MVQIGNDWDEILAGEFEKPYYRKLRAFLAEEYRTHTVYPDMHSIFQALKLTPYNSVKVVLLGQDPYHGAGQAHGLAFSVQKGISIPPSLLNIFKELKEDCGCYIPNNGYLAKWANQGVLLLNSALTVRAGKPNSHRGYGWEIFTTRIIQLLNDRPKRNEQNTLKEISLFDPSSQKEQDAALDNTKGIVFLLWGANAKEKASYITSPKHTILSCAHPSPYSADRGFFGCRHFSKTNQILTNMGYSPIDWQIENI